MIRACRPADAAQICAIYNPYVGDTVITFEEEPVAEAEMARRITAVTALLPWLVWEREGVIEGYAYATPWKARSAYRLAVESTVYVSSGSQRLGFTKVAQFLEVGWKLGRYVDVGYWELIL